MQITLSLTPINPTRVKRTARENVFPKLPRHATERGATSTGASRLPPQLHKYHFRPAPLVTESRVIRTRDKPPVCPKGSPLPLQLSGPTSSVPAYLRIMKPGDGTCQLATNTQPLHKGVVFRCKIPKHHSRPTPLGKGSRVLPGTPFSTQGSRRSLEVRD